jgi:glycosyltransferase involved in cell wall biosynthesis
MMSIFYHSGERLGDPKSGAAIVAGSLLKALARHGFEVGPQAASAAEVHDFLHRPARDEEKRVLIGSGRDPATPGLFGAARRRGIITVLHLHDFNHRRLDRPEVVDAVVVPSGFAADYYREAMGLDCHVLPSVVDRDRIRPAHHDPRYVTFVNPREGKGVYAFARIADELGRRRPDIPLLVVEGRGTGRTLADCGLDLRGHGTVHLLANTPDPRQFWGVTRICLMPSLGWEAEGLVAVEAMSNGIPVIASDRGALRETLGAAGVVLPLPDRITPATRVLPTVEEVEPWVEAVIRLWDDAGWYRQHRQLALAEASRWAPESVEPRYIAFLRDLAPRAGPPFATPRRRCRAVVLVPHLAGLEPECEAGLLRLEREGVRVVRRPGSSQIDVARNEMASDALHDGFETIMFIDADIGFDPADALRLIARQEPVIAGVYAKKGRRELASHFADGITEIRLGLESPGLYPLEYTATGFLRIRAYVLRRMIEECGLPLCNTHQGGRGSWPLFQPVVVPLGDGFHYLGEDWAFSHRLARIRITPLADTSIRLWHFGRYAYGWEDAGSPTARYSSYRCKLAPTDAQEASHRASVGGTG